MFSPTFVDIGIFIGTIGFFFVLFLLYARTFPVIAQAEVKSILKGSGEKYKKLRAEHGDDVKHYSPVVREPASNTSHVDTANTSEDQNPTVNADALITSELQRDQLDSMLSRLGTFDPATQTADDLKKISGVGPVMEQKLHQLGLYTFDQVSKMNDADYDLLDEIIGEFPGRAKRDDWAGQASKLKNN